MLPMTPPDLTVVSPAAPLLERLLDGISRLVMPIALVIVLLLCLQWPMRDWIGAGSGKANDLAQWLFALYVAVALRHAGQRGAHLVSRPDLAQAGHGALRAVRVLGAPLAVLPWSLFLLIQGTPSVARSVRGLERFPETANFGYFFVKSGLLVLAALLAVQALIDLVRAGRQLLSERRAP